MNNEPLNDSLQFNLIPFYTNYDFYYANSLNVSTYALGNYENSSDGFYSFVNNSTLEMSFSLFYSYYHINAKIVKLTRNKLFLEYEDNGNTYFMKLYAN